MTTIPTIDISPFLDGTNKRGVAKQVGEACEDIGFFMIKGHGVSLELLEKVQRESKQFFDLPLETKKETVAPFGLGYMGEGTENVAATLEEDCTVQDTKESLNLTLPVRDEVWPRNPPELSKVCEYYYESVQTLASQLMRLFALALDLEEAYFDDKIDNSYTTLRLLNYPELPQSMADISNTTEPVTRNAEHTDYGTLTILWSSDSRGLQAKSRQDVWIDVVAPKDQFIINIGDLMMNWTNDKWISTLHRVIPHHETLGQRRMSIPFFHNPNPEAMIQCIESCCDEKNPPKYQPILAKSHLEMKVSKALGQKEKMV